MTATLKIDIMDNCLRQYKLSKWTPTAEPEQTMKQRES